MRIGVLTVLKNAFWVFFRNFGIVIVLAVVAGGLGSLVIDAVGTWIGEQVVGTPKATGGMAGIQSKQALLVATQLGMTAVMMVWGSVVGAWAAPAAIYLWVQHEKGKPANLYDAVNFGLNRWRRVLLPHAIAYSVITFGNIFIIVGAYFALQYAFVDAIATLDADERDPVARSRKLTLGRRGTIARTFAFFLLWWVPYQFILFFLIQAEGQWLLSVATGTVDHLVLLLVDLCMVQLYLDIFRKPKPAAAGDLLASSAGR